MIKLMNTIQLAKMLGVSRHTLESWRSNGFGPPFIKTLSLVFYSHEKVLQWLELNTYYSIREYRTSV